MLALLALVAACAGGDAAPVRREGGTATASAPAATPGEGPADGAAARARADLDCERCHEAESARWRGSMHARAFVDPVFQAEHSGDPWCVGCHAPLALAAAPAAGIERGVGCTACHSPHAPGEPVTTRSCDGCHDFAFPDDHGTAARRSWAPGQRLQRTAAEWRTSAAAARGTGCVDCHDPHAVPGARSDSLWRDALSLEVSATRGRDAVEVTVRLAVRGAGHAVPTGDVFRRLAVRAEDATRECADEDETCWDEDVLRRRFRRATEGMVEVADDRVPADGSTRVVRLRLGADVARVRWSVVWEALDPHLAEARGLAEDRVRRVVAAGEVVPAPGRADAVGSPP